MSKLYEKVPHDTTIVDWQRIVIREVCEACGGHGIELLTTPNGNVEQYCSICDGNGYVLSDLVSVHEKIPPANVWVEIRPEDAETVVNMFIASRGFFIRQRECVPECAPEYERLQRICKQMTLQIRQQYNDLVEKGAYVPPSAKDKE